MTIEPSRITPSSMVILPGLDGTDCLLRSFVELAPKSVTVSVVALPDDWTDTYESLVDKIAVQIQRRNSCHLVAESFSGPLAILLAHRFPEIISCLTLVASFASTPVPRLARLLPWSLLFRVPLPKFVAKRILVGGDDGLVDDLRDAVAQSSPTTLVRRMGCLMSVDVTAQLSELSCNLQYIRPTEDRLVGERSMKAILNANANVEVFQVKGPHLILQSRPTESWRILAEIHQRCF